MWLVEAINTLDTNHLDSDGIYAGASSHLGDPHLAVHPRELPAPDRQHGAVRVPGADHRAARRQAAALVTGFIIVIGGLGTWLISPAQRRPGSRVHDRRQRRRLRLRHIPAHARLLRPQHLGAAVGMIVGVIWGAVLISSLVPHTGISWQAHLCGGIGGDRGRGPAPHERSAPPSPRREASAETPRRPPARRPASALVSACARSAASLRVHAHLLRNPADRPQAPRQLHRRDRPVRRRPGARRGDLLHRRPARDDGRLRPAELREAVYDPAAVLLAAGLDPERCVLFRQSDVLEHAELQWLLRASPPTASSRA